MKEVVIVGAGIDGSLARQLAAHGVEVVTGEVRARMVQALLPPGGGRWPDPDPRFFRNEWPKPSGEPLIVLHDPTPVDLRRIHAAKAKRERRQERNSINEARQGRPPDELEWRDGEWLAQCRRCGNDYPIEVEASRFSWEMNMCGRNEWCIP